MTVSYYRCDWPHPGNEDPTVMLYEVDADGAVPRMIEIFCDGKRSCVSVKDFVGRENELRGIDSLVEGSFFDAAAELLDERFVRDEDDEVTLVKIGNDEFDVEWRAHRRAD